MVIAISIASIGVFGHVLIWSLYDHEYTLSQTDKQSDRRNDRSRQKEVQIYVVYIGEAMRKR